MSEHEQGGAPADWWMYHGDPQHTGHATGSNITTATVAGLAVLHGSTSTGRCSACPPSSAAYVYVGVANSHAVEASNGGSFYKIALESGEIVARYDWKTPLEQRDSHGFCGMGCTPAVAGGRVVFSAFDGKLYSLDAGDLAERWVLDLRHADLALNQPVTNVGGEKEDFPPAAGWSSPVVVGEKSTSASAKARTRSCTASSTAWRPPPEGWCGSTAPTSSRPASPTCRTTCRRRC